ncbi:unnamed protein product [Leuciscus chuanchicus]
MLLTCPLCPSKVVHLRHHLRSQHHIVNSEERKILLKLARGRIKLRNIRCPECDIIYENVERHLKSGHPELTGKMVKLLTKQLEREVAEEQLQKLNNGQQLDPTVLSALDGPVETPLHIPEECLQLLDEFEMEGAPSFLGGRTGTSWSHGRLGGRIGRSWSVGVVRGRSRAVGRFLVKLAVRGTNRLFVSVGVVGGGSRALSGTNGRFVVGGRGQGICRKGGQGEARALRGRPPATYSARVETIAGGWASPPCGRCPDCGRIGRISSSPRRRLRPAPRGPPSGPARSAGPRKII